MKFLLSHDLIRNSKVIGFNFLIIFFIFNKFELIGQNQNRVVQIYLTYDQWFEEKYGNDALIQCLDIFQEVQSYYLEYDLEFQIVGEPKLIYLNSSSTTNHFRAQIANYFEEGNICTPRDMIHHFTSYSNLGAGTSGGLNLCEVNTGNPNISASFSRHVDANDWINAAHEIGHNLGLIHNDCDGNLLMCETGPENSNEPFFLNQVEIDRINEIGQDSDEACVFDNATSNCEICEFSAMFKQEGSSDFNVDCNSNVKELFITYNNSCERPRSATFSYKIAEGEINMLEVDPKFQNVTATHSVSGGIKYLTYEKFLTMNPNQVLNFQFKINIEKGRYADDKYLTDFNFRAIGLQDISPLIDPSNEYVFYGLPICSFNDAALPTNITTVYNECGTHFYPEDGPSICVSDKPKKIQFANELIINYDTYLCKNSEIEFLNDNGRILVKSGRPLHIDGAKIFTCGDFLWKGIFVENGANLIIENGAIISNALYGVDIPLGAEVSINGSFFNDCYIGINLQSNAELTNFTGNKIQTLNGVKSNTHNVPNVSSSTYIGLKINANAFATIGSATMEKNIFAGSIIGIHCSDASPIIINNRFEDLSFPQNTLDEGIGILVINSPLTSIKSNSFNVCNVGVQTSDSGVELLKNFIADVNRGIRIRKNLGKAVMIEDNHVLLASTGIELSFVSGAIVNSNSIEITKGNRRTAGIYVGLESTLNTVSNNTITVVTLPNSFLFGTGIVNVASSDNDYIENTIFLGGYASPYTTGIALNGGSMNKVSCNFEDNFNRGIYTDNSPGNELTCNSLFSKNVNININDNCPMQMLKGNELDKFTQTNIALESAIGIQNQHGNKWILDGGVLGVDGSILSTIESNQSKFFVDINKSNSLHENWYPKKANGEINADPIEIIKDESSEITFQCGNTCTNGAGNLISWLSSSTSPEEICKWLKTVTLRLKPSQIRWWKLYLVRILKKSGRNFNTLSPCLQSIFLEVQNSKQNNVENVKDNILSLSKVHNQSTNSLYSEALLYLHDNNHIVNKNIYLQKINNIKNTIANNSSIINQLSNSINADLNVISGETDYLNDYVSNLNLLNFLNNQNINHQNLTLINELCSEEAGENVFLSKSLLWLSEDVSLYSDECDVEPRDSNKLNMEGNNFSISPNPASSNVKVISNNDIVYSYTIYDLNGKVVLMNTNLKSNSQIDLHNITSGIYFIKILNITTLEIEVHKFTKL